MTTPTEHCDRCGRGEAARQDFCQTCGPILLCSACAAQHRDEIQDDEV